MRAALMLISRGVAFQSVRLKFVDVGAEGVRFDDVGAGANVFGVNLADEIGRDKIQFVVGAIDVDALGIEHRSHRAVEDVNAVGFEQVSKVSMFGSVLCALSLVFDV